MDFFETKPHHFTGEKKEIESPYLVLLAYNENDLSINIQHKKKEFITTQLTFKEKYKDYILDFKDLIEKIKDKNGTVIVCIEEKKDKNYLEIKFQKKDNPNQIIISEKIYPLNIEYYLTKGPNNERLYQESFSTYIPKKTINLKETLELLEREKISDCYFIDNIKYFNDGKKAFQKLKQNRIPIGNKKILEFHISRERNILIKNIKWTKEHYNEECKTIMKRLNKYSDRLSKYDLIYLYASPIVTIENKMDECYSSISYFKEIKYIFDIINKSGKKFNCKFECMNEKTLKEVLMKSKAKILHLSCHGVYDKKKDEKEYTYKLILEKTDKCGEKEEIKKNRLENIFNEINDLSQYDLIILTSCYSGHLRKLFKEKGAKNVIYIHKKTEVLDNVSVMFTYYFYNNLIKGFSIQKSYEDSIKSLQDNPEIADKNKNTPRCYNHYHKEGCNYRNANGNLKFEPCCCGNDEEKIEHDEIKKIKYKQKNVIYQNISPLKYNDKGKICVNDSKIKFFYDTEKAESIITRRVIMANITKSINEKKNKFAILYGEKELQKEYFVETLCVYLFERRIIDNYEIMSISSDFDFNNLNNDLKNIVDQKTIKIIKFDNNNNDINFKNFNRIYDNFLKNSKHSNIFFIFIFDFPYVDNRDGDLKKKTFENNLSEYMSKNNKNIIPKLKNNINLFYPGINENKLLEIINENYKVKLSNDDIKYIEKIGKNNPKIIKIIIELLNLGEKMENIKKMTIEEIIKKHKIVLKPKEKKRIYQLYYLLLILPSGLPNSFLELLFEDYNTIIDEDNLISENKEDNSNWKIIDKVDLDNFKDDEACNICLFYALKYYTMILIYFIEKNRENVNNSGGTFHYLFNSFSTEKIWKYKTFNNIEQFFNKETLKKDFIIHIQKHKDNILSLISYIVENITKFRNINEISKEIDFYLEDILLLFPSYFFLEIDNIKILKKCIELLDRLIVDENTNKRQKQLKLKLMLFLYSINKSEDKNLESLMKKAKEAEPELFLEYNFLKEIRNDEINLGNLENMLKKNITDDMRLNLYYEIAKIYYKKEKGENKNCLEYFNKALKSEEIIKNFYDIKQNRIMLDYCYVFKKNFKKENNDNYNEIKPKINSLKEILVNPSHKYIYYESVNLRNEIYSLLRPDIVILNSNPLKNNNSNYIYSPNNQYYILSQLRKDIKHHIRIKSNILNKENLNLALNEKGEILIIQSDDFTEKCEIVCENENGESEILQIDDELIKKFNNYKVVILCFPKSKIFGEYLDKKKIEYQYIISFGYIDKKEENMIKQFNKKSIKFIIDFIKESLDKNGKNIENIIKETKNQSLINNESEEENKENNNNNNLEFNSYINVFRTGKELNFDNNNISSKIEFQFNKELTNYNKIYLYGSFPSFSDINSFKMIDEYSKDYSLQIYNLINKIKAEKKIFFYSDMSNKRIHLKMSFDVMKFFYRHKTFCELFYIDISKENDVTLLKSVIRKLKILKKKNYKIEDDDDEEDKYIKKACFLLIYNCKKEDLISINIYSILKCNSSFIIIIDLDEKENNHKKDEAKVRVGENDENFTINDLNSDKVFLLIFDYDNINFVDDDMIFAYYENYEKDVELTDNNLKSLLINTKIDILQYGNLYQDLKSGIPSEGEEYVFPFDLKEIKLFYSKILKLVQKLHNSNYSFLKIEPSYIMFDKDYNPILINLGNTRGQEGNLEKYIEINQYTPLELYESGKNINKLKIDIFNLGILLYELLFRKMPFQVPIDECLLYSKIREAKNKNYDEFWNDPKNANIFGGWKEKNDINDFKNLFINMVSSNPDERCSIDDILENDFMKEICDNKDNLKDIEETMKEKFVKIRNDVINKENTEIILGEEKQPQEEEKKIKEGTPDIIKNNIIKIILNDKKPNDFMSELKDWIQNNPLNTKNTKSVVFSENISKIDVKAGDKKEYSIELFKTKNKKNGYFMKFDYFDGGLSEFDNRIELTRGYLENLDKEQKK